MPGLKLLLDECVDRRLAQAITGHDLRTVPQMGWAGLRNGVLLAKAVEEGFDVFVTVDLNLSFFNSRWRNTLFRFSCCTARATVLRI